MDKEKTFLYVIIALITLLLCTTVSTGIYKYKYNRLMEQHRTELELARARSAVLSGTIESIREEVSGFGASLSRQRNNTAQLRELIKEARTRYEKMEKLLNSSGDNYNNIRDFDSSPNNNNGEIENE